MQMIVNGFVVGPNPENDWMTWNPDDEFLKFLRSHFDSSDTIFLGRKLADGFIEHWENVAGCNPQHFLPKNSRYSESRFYQNARKIALEQHRFGKKKSIDRKRLAESAGFY